jgi:hypothetical protein
MEPPVCSRRLRPLLLENILELTQGFHDVVGIHHSPPRDVVSADDVLRAEEGQDHLLAPAGVPLGLDGARWALSQPLLASLLV